MYDATTTVTVLVDNDLKQRLDRSLAIQQNLTKRFHQDYKVVHKMEDGSFRKVAMDATLAFAMRHTDPNLDGCYIF